MKKVLILFLIIFVLPLILYEGYYQYTEAKKNTVMSKKENTDKNAVQNTEQHAVQKVSTTNIRYVDRGHYWNYPYHEKFIAYNEDGEEITIHTDALGFRNEDVKQNYDILLLGDSFTSAANTKDELTFAHLLKKQGFSVYNAGIDGTGTIHQAHILEDVLQKITPKLVVLNFYLGNDYRDNFYCPDIQISNVQKNVKTDMVAQPSSQPRNQPSDKTAELKSKFLFVTLKAKLNNLMQKSGVLKLFYNAFYLPAKYQGTDMSYYDRGEMMIMAHNKDNPIPDTLKAIQKTEDALRYIKNTLEARKIPLLVVGIPSKAQVLKSIREISNFDMDEKGGEFFSKVKKDIDFDRPDRILSLLCIDLQIPYVSLLDPFRKQYHKKLYYHFDAHWNYIGQEAAVNEVIPYIKKALNAPVRMPLFANAVDSRLCGPLTLALSPLRGRGLGEGGLRGNPAK